MLILTFLIRVMEAVFSIGLVGSAVVVAISFVEDAIELFGPDDPNASHHISS